MSQNPTKKSRKIDPRTETVHRETKSTTARVYERYSSRQRCGGGYRVLRKTRNNY